MFIKGFEKIAKDKKKRSEHHGLRAMLGNGNAIMLRRKNNASGVIGAHEANMHAAKSTLLGLGAGGLTGAVTGAFLGRRHGMSNGARVGGVLGAGVGTLAGSIQGNHGYKATKIYHKYTKKD